MSGAFLHMFRWLCAGFHPLVFLFHVFLVESSVGDGRHHHHWVYSPRWALASSLGDDSVVKYHA
jgi:hypothetical protein